MTAGTSNADLMLVSWPTLNRHIASTYLLDIISDNTGEVYLHAWSHHSSCDNNSSSRCCIRALHG